MAPQQQAKLLIERGLNGYRGALEQIEARLESWQGQLEPTKELETMLGAAYNANDLRVRAAAIEVSLVAHKVEKSAATAERLRNELPTAEGSKAWRLWMVGLLANRGIETGRAIETLLYYSRDPEEHTRYWAVQALAHIGADSTIEPLLRIMHDDPSHDVRERAACGLAQSGMLTSEQRRQAVPALLRYTDDSSLDETTRKWAFQALRDITGQSLPEDPAAWRNWHARTTAR
jgi:HEAT repeat protein